MNKGSFASLIPTELVERLSAATVGSRELDADIAALLLPGVVEWRTTRWTMEAEPHRKVASANHVGGFAREPVYPVTTSLDAALALAERLLPGAEWRGGSGRSTDGTRPWARLGPWSDPDAVGSSIALATCIAILKALPTPTPSEETPSTSETEERG